MIFARQDSQDHLIDRDNQNISVRQHTWMNVGQLRSLKWSGQSRSLSWSSQSSLSRYRQSRQRPSAGLYYRDVSRQTRTLGWLDSQDPSAGQDHQHLVCTICCFDSVFVTMIQYLSEQSRSVVSLRISRFLCFCAKNSDFFQIPDI
jgi:hypothetical protein